MPVGALSFSTPNAGFAGNVRINSETNRGNETATADAAQPAATSNQATEPPTAAPTDRITAENQADDQRLVQINDRPESEPESEPRDYSVDSVSVSSTIGLRASSSGLSREQAVEIYQQVSKLL